MKGVSYLRDQYNQNKAIVIDLNTIRKHSAELITFLEGVIAESRKKDEKVPLKEVLSNLKKMSKLTT